MKVFPSKHVLLSETCYGLGGVLIKLYEEGDDIDSLLDKFKSELKVYNENLTTIVNRYYLTLSYLYALDIIEVDEDLRLHL